MQTELGDLNNELNNIIKWVFGFLIPHLTSCSFTPLYFCFTSMLPNVCLQASLCVLAALPSVSDLTQVAGCSSAKLKVAH